LLSFENNCLHVCNKFRGNSFLSPPGRKTSLKLLTHTLLKLISMVGLSGGGVNSSVDSILASPLKSVNRQDSAEKAL